MWPRPVRSTGVIASRNARPHCATSSPTAPPATPRTDRKSTRLNSSHRCISYAVFCLKKKMIKKVDATTAEHTSCQMGSFVVFLSDAEDLQAKLKDVAEKENIKKTVLSIDKPAGPISF